MQRMPSHEAPQSGGATNGQGDRINGNVEYRTKNVQIESGGTRARECTSGAIWDSPVKQRCSPLCGLSPERRLLRSRGQRPRDAPLVKNKNRPLGWMKPAASKPLAGGKRSATTGNVAQRKSTPAGWQNPHMKNVPILSCSSMFVLFARFCAAPLGLVSFFGRRTQG